MKYALYVDDPIGYEHLIAEFNDLNREKELLYSWARGSTILKQWQLDYPDFVNLLWFVIPVKGRMPEIGQYIYDKGIKEISREDWQKIYDDSW
jgi:hypothetical protein